MWRGEGPTSTSRENRSGSAIGTLLRSATLTGCDATRARRTDSSLVSHMPCTRPGRGLHPVGAHDIDPAGAGQVGAGEPGAAQVGVGDRGAGQVGAACVGAAQIGP